MPKAQNYSLEETLNHLRITESMVKEWAANRADVGVVSDHAEDLIEFLRSYGVKVQHGGSTDKLPFLTRTMDVVIYYQVISYQPVEKRASTIENIVNSLKYDGTALIADFSAYVYHKAEMEVALKAKAKTIDQSVTLTGPDSNRYPIRFLKLKRYQYFY